jgi:hypothetical protein
MNTLLRNKDTEIVNLKQNELKLRELEAININFRRKLDELNA